MAMSTHIRAIHAAAAAYSDKLRADDVRLRRSVLLIHEEGTTMLFRKAFRMTTGRDYVVVFTEHHGFHIYHNDEVHSLFQFQDVVNDRHKDLFTAKR